MTNAPIKINAIRYRTLSKCLAAYFDCSVSELPKITGAWEWLDADGVHHSYSHKDAMKLVRRRKCWGFLEDKDTIHYWAGKGATELDLLDLFAHEIGHMERPYHRSLQEEQKANKYSKVATIAYCAMRDHFEKDGE